MSEEAAPSKSYILEDYENSQICKPTVLDYKGYM